MSALLQLRDAIATSLAADARLVALKVQVTVHGGDFRTDDLTKYAKNAPAVVVSLLHVDVETTATSEVWANCTFGIACIAKPRPPRDQHAMCVDLVDATLRALRGSFWDLLDLSPPKQITARNLFGAGLDKIGGIGMWAIGFHQSVELAEDEDTGVAWSWLATWDPQPVDEDRPHAQDAGDIEPP
jgi:hypothetical protein